MEASKLRHFDVVKLRKYPPIVLKKNEFSYQNGAVLDKIRVSPLTKTTPYRPAIKPKLQKLFEITSDRTSLPSRPSSPFGPPLSLKKIPTVH
jgi:hypothetical protein